MADYPRRRQLLDQLMQDLISNKPAPLSPAAQAVRDAFNAEWPDGLAAALRVAADQVVPPLDIKPQEDLGSRREAMEWGMNSQTQLTRDQLLAIAAELERQ
jgi:hypothetical protein